MVTILSFSQRVGRLASVQVMTHVPCLPVLRLEVSQCRGLPEKVIRKHSQQSKKHCRVQKPCTGLCLAEHLKHCIDLHAKALIVTTLYAYLL